MSTPHLLLRAVVCSAIRCVEVIELFKYNSDTTWSQLFKALSKIERMLQKMKKNVKTLKKKSNIE